MTERIYVVDVSRVQGTIDWSKVRGHDPGAALGGPPGEIQGAIVKATEGARYLDPRCRAYLEGARAEGLAVGVYHFARCAGNPLEQADRLLALGLEVGDDPSELPVWLDLEEGDAAVKAGGPDALVEWAIAWLERIEAAGYRAGLYTMPSFGAQWRGAQRLAELARWPLWVAHYARRGAWVPGETAQPMKLAPWERWAMWQFSGGGPGLPGNVVPGILEGVENGFTDLNLVNEGLAGWRRLLGVGEGDEGPVLEGGVVHGTHVVEGALAEYRHESEAPPASREQ